MQHAAIRFHSSLNDFLRKRQKNLWNIHLFRTPSSVKDAMEALGVPHVEIDKIIINGNSKDFTYRLQNGDQVEAFPFENHFPETTPKSFVLDVHLGKLARLLRMLGIDAVYQNQLEDNEIVAIAIAENRAVLTRDIGLLKHKVLRYGYWLRSQDPEQQLVEVLRVFSLCKAIRPFTLCIACNGRLTAIPKSDVLPLLPEETKAVFEEFYQCNQCGKVYWKGPHYNHMQGQVQRLVSLACH